ncbi:hypothetical protein BWQ96_00868 [Gracilariopsis chorda]|uniref:C2H2-type domain-containing protein n=1 Tax=Gracilariopsis chorda TaxID=448386 RepID=A0A2V3J4I9_9FLOR|nr:hypothetical protein BWQ96_00868 [Gracilariopsis chorda]|eukprot:PXF49294.1 hypothetical protein BWQ96_00868 [Gracilariopsis chorda]
MSASPLPPVRLPPFHSLTNQLPLTLPPMQPSTRLPSVQSLYSEVHRSRSYHPTGNNHDALISHIRNFAPQPPAIRDSTELVAQPGDVSRPHACKMCLSTFRRRDNLMAHIRAQHKGERPFECSVCGYRFIKKDHAVKHLRVVHLKERPHVCTHCNSRFGQRSDLNKHVRSVHLRIKPFACEHCGIKFSHRGNQIRHQQVVHEKRKPFACAVCHASFAEKSNLVKHCQAVHRTSLPPTSPTSSRRH